MLARAEGYARVEEAFNLMDEEAVGVWQVGESIKFTIIEKPSEAQSCSRTSTEH